MKPLHKLLAIAASATFLLTVALKQYIFADLTLPAHSGYDLSVSADEAQQALLKVAPHLPRHGSTFINYQARLPLNCAIKLARTGNPAAEYLIGWMYESSAYGPTTSYDERDIQRAIKWYKLAAQHGCAAAAAELGYIYEWGSGVPEHYALAQEWYKQAADAGDAQGEIDLGLMCEQGKGRKPDLRQAMALYERAAKFRDDEGIQWQGKLMVESLWVRTCEKPSADFSRGASNAFEFVSKYGGYWETGRVAEIYDFGTDVAPDRAKALALYKISRGRSPAWSDTEEEALAIATVNQRIATLERSKMH